MKKIKINLMNVLDWGSGDITALERYLTIADLWGISIYDIADTIEFTNGDKTKINDWFYTVIELIFSTVMKEVQEVHPELETKIEKLNDNFLPFINYLDSWFNNFLDDVELYDEKEKVIAEIAERLVEED